MVMDRRLDLGDRNLVLPSAKAMSMCSTREHTQERLSQICYRDCYYVGLAPI
jgi:hypothetical protein